MAKEVKEKVELLLKLASTFSSGWLRIACSSFSNSSAKSSTSRSKFCRSFLKKKQFICCVNQRKSMMIEERSVVNLRQRIRVVMRTRDETVPLSTLGLPAVFLLHNLSFCKAIYILVQSLRLSCCIYWKSSNTTENFTHTGGDFQMCNTYSYISYPYNEKPPGGRTGTFPYITSTNNSSLF